jgi:chemotaxis protein CheD
MIHANYNLVKVGMADSNVLKGIGILKTVGLGSCVGLTLYDPSHKISGMVHVMLPSSEIARQTDFKLAKYADTGIPDLIEKMLKLGAVQSNLSAKLAGGSQMFAHVNANSDFMRIGPRNVESCKAVLQELSIPILAEDTGGNYGRTIEFQSNTGKMFIHSVHQGVKEI